MDLNRRDFFRTAAAGAAAVALAPVLKAEDKEPAKKENPLAEKENFFSALLHGIYGKQEKTIPLYKVQIELDKLKKSFGERTEANRELARRLVSADGAKVLKEFNANLPKDEKPRKDIDDALGSLGSENAILLRCPEIVQELMDSVSDKIKKLQAA